ncbi:hypothetical protein GUITHDRAFT_150688 [Guillardia theta CCMP2712]|uniref:Zinc-ribbon domain-containing protein n=1 Tax=Guillardia theta (strain CCMP2712) TaxID=905079 RepID=L1JV73_GUITC|nr:hypothetical protein GUITHDRAFT_150688 [Guillardia theta CCMP2712]EKX52110.1 hypothetical protein GUITHDRAFT_150688 [Guillardia theta CCMP2712]|eukprot:XP_005839090.1 hypothetical protein GUITHDRAFT_150688 [Guillardia theta CCMP2712]
MPCPRCGAAITGRFCGSCGMDFEQPNKPPQPSAPDLPPPPYQAYGQPVHGSAVPVATPVVPLNANPADTSYARVSSHLTSS